MPGRRGAAGAVSRSLVVRSRRLARRSVRWCAPEILLTRIGDWEVVARVHGDFFRDIRPANTIMEVSRFIDPDWLVEIEADAVIES